MIQSLSTRLAKPGWVFGSMLVAGIALVAAGWFLTSHLRRPRRYRAAPVTTSTPFRNTRVDVAFVGSAACGGCHAEIAASYGAHPMGRSLARVDAAAEAARAGGKPPHFEVQGLQYDVAFRGGEVVHSETRKDAQGQVVARVETPVRYALGSGTRGVSYLVDRDHHLFQSPVSWYSEPGRFDLAPGYAASHAHFERPIGPACLFCHADRFVAVPGSVNGYRPPVFEGLAIGCERCHGPGALHAANPGEVGGGPDLTIVNPSRLSPTLRDDVCAQCHLQGSVRVARAGRDETEYRPGLPLREFVSVFVSPEGEPGENRAVGHVEQMRASRCYLASGGRLGCVSCHDPHRNPPPNERAGHYRSRCLTCHTETSCPLPVARRRATAPDDACTVCHMPRSSLSNIPHTAATDHRIPRDAATGGTPWPPAKPRPRGMPLEPFDPPGNDPGSRRELERDLGMALSQWAERQAGPTRATGLRLAEARLNEAAAWRPGDTPALLARARVLAVQGRADDALAAAEAVLNVDPASEPALALAGTLAAVAGRRDEAMGHLRRALRINPWNSSYFVTIAKVNAQNREWPAALDACRAALRLDPTNLDARRLQMRSALESRDLAAARSALREFLGFEPPDAERYRRLIEGPR